MTRRELIRSSLRLAAGVLYAGGSSGVRVGAQTNAWKVDLEDFSSLNDVLERVRKLGYEGFETSYRTIQPAFRRVKQARAELGEHGLRFFGCQISLTNYEAKSNAPPADLIEMVAEKSAALGAERLILSGAPLAGDGSIDEQRLRWKAGALSRAGRTCEPLKLRLCYHNHEAEFESGEMSQLARETDPDNVRFVIDAGYALRAKADVTGFFLKHHKRIEGLHLRDFDNQDVQVTLGKGVFQYEPLAAAMHKTHWNGWLIAEEEREGGDKPGDAAMGPAREQIRKVFGV